MRLIFINRFYWPEEPATAQLLADLAEALAAAGHDVTVIASRGARRSLAGREVHNGVTVLRTGFARWSRNGTPGKALDFLTFYFGALVKLALTAESGDTVVALTDPPFIGIGAWLAARLCGARIFHWVQDIYPEIAERLTGQTWLRVVRPLRDVAWRRSDGCVTLGSDMAGTISQAGVSLSKLFISPNWSPAGLTPQTTASISALRTAWHLEGKFVVAYSGNLGRVHDLDPVVDVAGALRDDPAIAFVFIGGGPKRAHLEVQAAQRGLTNVHFHPAQPREQLGASLGVGDVHLVTLLPGCEALVFPSKLYGIAAAGRPVLFIGPRNSEIARLIVESGVGLAFERADLASLITALRTLAQNPSLIQTQTDAALAFSQWHTGPDRAAAQWQKMLTSRD